MSDKTCPECKVTRSNRCFAAAVVVWVTTYVVVLHIVAAVAYRDPTPARTNWAGFSVTDYPTIALVIGMLWLAIAAVLVLADDFPLPRRRAKVPCARAVRRP